MTTCVVSSWPIRAFPGCITLNVVFLKGRLVQGLERDIQDLQVFSEHATGSMAQMEEQVGSSQRNNSALRAALARAAASIHGQDAALHDTVGRMDVLRQKLDEVDWTVGSINHSLSSHVSTQRLQMELLQVQLGNVTQDARSTRITQIHLEEQMRNELEILNVITEDLRLKDWEHSMALKNITVIEGKRKVMRDCTAMPVYNSIYLVTKL